MTTLDVLKQGAEFEKSAQGSDNLISILHLPVAVVYYYPPAHISEARGRRRLNESPRLGAQPQNCIMNALQNQEHTFSYLHMIHRFIDPNRGVTITARLCLSSPPT